jgi:murein DD-endopeptidase MepM/ murein hydrolase activator NlpD
VPHARPQPRVGLPYAAVHMVPPIHSGGLSRWAVEAGTGTLSGMSRVLICAMLITVLSGGAGAGMVALTALAVQPGPDEAGDQPRWRMGMFGWPLSGSPTVVRAFQAPTSRFGPGHRGVDLAAVAGAPVLAAGAGTVVFTGAVAGHSVVSVDHPGGLRTTYEPVSPTVTAGDRVARGQQIGTVAPGHLGCTATACLHWGVLRGPAHDREYLDPLRLVVIARVRLLPDRRRSTAGDARRSSAGGGVEHLAP